MNMPLQLNKGRKHSVSLAHFRGPKDYTCQLSLLHGASSGGGCKRRPSDMEAGHEYSACTVSNNEQGVAPDGGGGGGINPLTMRYTGPYLGRCSELAALLAACLSWFRCLDYSLTLKVEAIYSSETSVAFRRTTRRYIPEDKNHHVDEPSGSSNFLTDSTAVNFSKDLVLFRSSGF
jgi:hypothetical protein